MSPEDDLRLGTSSRHILYRHLLAWLTLEEAVDVQDDLIIPAIQLPVEIEHRA
jgi:hypothetical protein